MNGLLTRRIDNRLLIAGLAWLVCGLSVAGYGGKWFWGLDLAVHFRVQYVWGLLVLGALLLKMKKPLAASACVIGLGINLIEILPVWIHPQPHPGLRGAPIRVMLVNVQTANPTPGKVVDLIEEEAPDIVALEEVDSQWIRHLEPVVQKYPHHKLAPRTDNFGIALLSRTPLQSVEVIYLGEAELPSILARMEIGGQPVSILATHPLPPGGAENSRLRNEQLAAIPSVLANLGGSRIVLGDLNTTPWSYHFKRLCREADLINSGVGLGLHASWPAGFLPLRIPLDHCLHTPDLIVTRKSIGASVGSDHFPLSVDLVIPGTG